jgi:hypothetical protein
MNEFLTQIFEKINTFFSQPTTLPFTTKAEENVYLCLFLKSGTDFIFLNPQQKEIVGKYQPLLVSLESLGKVEDNFYRINDFFFENFDISPEKINLVKEYLSLSPLHNHVYYFAIVDLIPEDLKLIQQKPLFKILNLPFISVNAEKNLFFNFLMKIIESSEYISV